VIVKQLRKTITFPQFFISAGLPARGDRPVRIVAGLPASESSYVSNIVFSLIVVNIFLYLLKYFQRSDIPTLNKKGDFIAKITYMGGWIRTSDCLRSGSQNR
jgi:hypothetical protein